MSNVWVSGSDLDIEINIARDAVKRAEYQAREALHKYMRAGIPEVSTGSGIMRPRKSVPSSSVRISRSSKRHRILVVKVPLAG